MLDRRFCIAPMMGWTDRHFRYFFRQISRKAVLFGEMLAPEALVFGKPERYLRFHPDEHPVVFQLGGNNPQLLAKAAVMIEQAGYDEINFNVGCPSKAVGIAKIGAFLFKQPQLVADCVSAMQSAVNIPISVKTRVGVDQDERYEPLHHFVDLISRHGCKIFYIHARNAWLEGLSTNQNRLIPQLRYQDVYRLKRDFPELTIVINGAISTLEQSMEHLQQVDGVMIGRKGYKEPFSFVDADRELFGDSGSLPSQTEILRRCIPYVEAELSAGTALRHIIRHQVGLYRHLPAATAFRRHIALEGVQAKAGLSDYLKAIEIAEGLHHPTKPPRTCRTTHSVQEV
jgi:tRNA-dihydrouridine synthase A